MSGYNGWKNYATWNVALWIGNDEGLYNVAKCAGTYPEFVAVVGSTATDDDVAWNDETLDIDALNEMMGDL